MYRQFTAMSAIVSINVVTVFKGLFLIESLAMSAAGIDN
jgi:hypothetical protein